MKVIKKQLGIYLFSGILLVCSPSCKDFLDLAPLDNRVEQNFYKTEKDAQEALNSVYDALQWHT